LKAPETKRQYPRRLKVFLGFLKLDGTLEQQSKEFLEKAKQNPQWAYPMQPRCHTIIHL